MLTIKELAIPGYEKVIEGKDPARGLHCFIAIHNCNLGPSLGGTRIHPYSTPEAALEDVLRLAKAMTYKSAILQDGLGGGKSVIIADPHTAKSQELLHAFAEVLDSLQGKYIAAEDVGTTPSDMSLIYQRTPYVAATSKERSSGDPSPFTAWGVLQGMRAVAEHLWNSPSLKGKTIAVQGLGKVGGYLTRLLFWEGADLIITDISPNVSKTFQHDCGARIIDPNEFCQIKCDILAPCAMGAVINATTVPQLQCKAIAGSANNQLATQEQADQLKKRGILYAPDYIINAGGLISVATEFNKGGYNALAARDKTGMIYEHLLQIFRKADSENKTPDEIANQLAEHNLTHGVGKRTFPISFKRH